MKLLQKKQQKPTRRQNVPSSSKEGRATDDELRQRYAFRRNRTLTGSLVSGVGSVGERSNELRSPRVQVHHLRSHRRRLLWIFLGIIVCAVGLFWAIYQSIATVHVVITAPIPPLATELYEQKIQEYLNGHPFERNRSTLNTSALTNYLQVNGAPETQRIAVKPQPTGFGASTFIISTREAVVSWKTGPTELFVDTSGTAFRRNYYSPPTVQVLDQTGIQTVNNQVLASDRFLGFIGRCIGQMKAQGYAVTKVTLPENTTRQLLVSVEGVSYPIKFSVDRPAGEQAEDAARSIRYLAGRSIVPEYLDVRLSGKAYYK